jgi:hypothetical protein
MPLADRRGKEAKDVPVRTPWPLRGDPGFILFPPPRLGSAAHARSAYLDYMQSVGAGRPGRGIRPATHRDMLIN